ncbi:phosphonate C-P lyase system protein PhnH [Cereibacter sp. SYSU M97828]|nr:phosphonate C-P lyase system protein PhnH [Cereibacter flavus]
MLEGGFTDQPRQSATAFRAALDAMARPGTIHTVAGAQPPALSIAAGVLLLTLADRTTSLWLAPPLSAARDWITFHTGATFSAPEDAQIAIGAWHDLPVARFPIGRPDYPDRSATLIVEMPDLTATGPRLTGPGIKDHANLSLPETEAFRMNATAFPLGLDFFFTAGDRLAALPRTTKVEAA